MTLARLKWRRLIRNAKKRRGSRALIPYTGGYKGFNPTRYNPIVSLCPDRMFVKLKFSESAQLSYDPLNPSPLPNRIYRGNGPGDPSQTSPAIGIQAYGYPIWASLYGRYYVTSSTIQVHAVGQTQTSARLVVYPVTFPVQPTNIDRAASRARVKQAILSNGDGTKRMYCKCTTKGAVGDRWNETWTADTSSSQPYPEREWFWIVAMGPNSQVASQATTLDITVTVTYNVMFYQRLPAVSESGSPSV